MANAGHTSRYPGTDKTRRTKAKDLGPLVKLDQERCILCTRCVRFTRNVTHTGEIVVLNRGHASEIAIHGNKSFDNPYSGNVVDICPVGALTSSDFRFKVRSWFLKGTSAICGGCSTGCNLRIDHSARAMGGGIPGQSASDGKIYRTVGRRNVDVNQSWLCDEGRLSFHAMERWPRLQSPRTHGETRTLDALLPIIHQRFVSIREEHGEASIAGLASATNTNEALFLMRKYFATHVDFRLGSEVEDYPKRQDDMLRRLDKHPNTHGAIDIVLAAERAGLGGLRGLRKMAEARQIRGMWISFHPQLIGDDTPEILVELQQLIGALDFSVVSTTHDFSWTAGATFVLPMAGWAEETGTYTNFAGRVQISNHAVQPPGEAQPLHKMMSTLLGLSGIQVSPDPAAIFEWIAREVSPYAGMDYDAIEPLGMPGVYTSQQEAVR
jgi:NADH-quinone oxidoreductase subunit G